MNKFLLMALLLLGSLTTHAQVQVSGCPPGVVPGQPGCGGSDSSDSVSEYKAPIWQDRYGAIAVDVVTGSYGWASGAKSKREAFKAAISDCGGGGCKVQADGRNTCLATAWGGGIRSYAAGASLEQVETAVLEKCNKNGTGAACKLDYSACSLPVRIR